MSSRLRPHRTRGEEARGIAVPIDAGMRADDAPHATVTRGQQTVPLECPRGLTDHPSLPFAWGFRGPACAQLALAILADYLTGEIDGEKRALRWHQEFHANVIAPQFLGYLRRPDHRVSGRHLALAAPSYGRG